MAAILVRTLLIYLILICTMRFSGKRQIGEMQISELATTFLLSELASVPLTDPTVPFLHALLPILIIVSTEIVFSFLATKWTIAKKLLDGKPSIIVKRGKLQKKEMERMRLSLDDLLCELRLKDVSSLSEVDYAILESNGKLSVFPRTAAPLSHVLIVDGVLQKDMLLALEKSEAWLSVLLQSQGISDMREIFLLSVADDNSLTLIRKGDCK